MNNAIYLSGIDFVNGTPVLDIKPYVPLYDSIPAAIVPNWIGERSTFGQVVFTAAAMTSLNDELPHLRFFQTSQDAAAAIEQMLSHDIRSLFQRSLKTQKPGTIQPELDVAHTSTAAPKPLYEVFLDNLRIQYVVEEDASKVVVVAVVGAPSSICSTSQRQKFDSSTPELT
mmetsp:Transcript_43763/g.85651  ORF Transcript_43763/g.85651 Transcript_43763/m.85651 type:complete len:171 (+) Transcript_43763:171-683(+)